MSDGRDPNEAVGELVRLVERLDADNERLRIRALDLLRYMEEAVTAQVAGERRIAELEAMNSDLERRLVEVESSLVVRLTARPRRVLARLRKR